MTIRIKNISDGSGGFEGSAGDKDLAVVDGVPALAFTETDLPIEKFLYAMQVKGARVCEDLQITNGGDIFLYEGTALSSIIKETELVFGSLTVVGGQVVFVAGNPAYKYINGLGSDSAPLDSESDSVYGGETLTSGNSDFTADGSSSNDKWYLRLTRPNGSVVYKEMKGINEILDPANIDGEISSIPEVLKQLHDLGVAVKAVMDQNQLSRMDDVDRLESAWDKYIEDFKAELQAVEDQMILTANARDLALYNGMIGRLEDRMEVIQGTMENDYAHASIGFDAVGLGTSSGVIATFNLSGGGQDLRSGVLDAERHDVKNWIIKAVVRDVASSMLYNDSVWNKAYIEDSQLKVHVRAVDSEALTASRYIEVTASYAGPLTSADAFPTDDPISLDSYGASLVTSEPALQDSDAANPAVKL